MQSVFSAAGIMENLLLLIDFLRLRSCLKSQECGFGKIFFQHFLPNLFNDCAFKFQGRRVCAKWGLFFSLFPVNSSCSGQETLRKMMYFSVYLCWIKVHFHLLSGSCKSNAMVDEILP